MSAAPPHPRKAKETPATVRQGLSNAAGGRVGARELGDGLARLPRSDPAPSGAVSACTVKDCGAAAAAAAGAGADGAVQLAGLERAVRAELAARCEREIREARRRLWVVADGSSSAGSVGRGGASAASAYEACPASAERYMSQRPAASRLEERGPSPACAPGPSPSPLPSDRQGRARAGGTWTPSAGFFRDRLAGSSAVRSVFTPSAQSLRSVYSQRRAGPTAPAPAAGLAGRRPVPGEEAVRRANTLPSLNAWISADLPAEPAPAPSAPVSAKSLPLRRAAEGDDGAASPGHSSSASAPLSAASWLTGRDTVSGLRLAHNSFH